MKNIHILPTLNPSRLVKNNFGIAINEDYTQSILDLIQAKFVNINITNDEEIKEGDWYIRLFDNTIYKASKHTDHKHYDFKKIILTTDQDLIEDGVQAINDEFLEWFIKNPSCEEIEVDYGFFTPFGRKVDPMGILQNHSKCVWKYKIIIPKEETLEEDLMMEVPMAQYPKIFKHEFKVVSSEEIVGKRLEKYSERFDNDKSPIGNPDTWGKRLVDETIEESFDRIYNSIDFTEFDFTSFKLGAKWLQENSCKHNYILTTEQGHRVIKCLKCDNTQPI